MSPAQELRLYYAIAAAVVVFGAPAVILSTLLAQPHAATHLLFAQFVALTVQLFTGATADRLGVKL